MNKFLFGFIFSLTSAAAFAGLEPNPPGQPPNLAVDIQAPGAVRAELQISIPSLKEVQRYEFSASGAGLTGGVYVPPGEGNFVSIQAFDERGEPIYSGSGVANVDKELTREIDIPLGGKETRNAPVARFGTYLLTLGFGASEGEGLTLQATLLDAAGNHVPFKPEDIQWKLPEGFELLPYSCFLDSLCIEIPDKVNPDILACWLDITCQINPPPDRRGPYRFVAVGKNHTCAITIDDDLRCWGDNQFGQLGAFTSNCLASNNTKPCSLVPVPVECSPGELCKFRWVAAGGDHTCAIDNNGNAWCWGEEGSFATGATEEFFGPDSPVHRHIPAANGKGERADFVAIDTNVGHTCGLSAAGDVYCWGNNQFGQLGFPSSHISGTRKATFNAMLVQNGNKYKSVVTGENHSCAIQTSGSLDCWGDNMARQIYNTNAFPFGNAFVTVTSKVPLLNNRAVSVVAAGLRNTCAQNAGNDLICWGAPDGRGNAITSGFVHMPAAFAISLATENEFCTPTSPFLECARTCVVDQWGTLSCGRWMQMSRPPLSEVPDPKTDHHVMFSQVDVGQSHVCAVTTHRDVWCFGENTFGQFGTGAFTSARTPAPLVPANR